MSYSCCMNNITSYTILGLVDLRFISYFWVSYCRLNKTRWGKKIYLNSTIDYNESCSRQIFRTIKSQPLTRFKRKVFMQQLIKCSEFKTFNIFQIRSITVKKMQTAEDFRDLHQLSNAFKVWRDYAVIKQIERKQNYLKAVTHHDR